MSRTHRQEKGCGYEYWSRRPFNKAGGIATVALRATVDTMGINE